LKEIARKQRNNLKLLITFVLDVAKQKHDQDYHHEQEQKHFITDFHDNRDFGFDATKMIILETDHIA
jgi:hypothetical protein